MQQGDHCPGNQGDQGKSGKLIEYSSVPGKVREFEKWKGKVKESQGI